MTGQWTDWNHFSAAWAHYKADRSPTLRRIYSAMTLEFIYEVPLQCGAITSMAPTDDGKFLLIDCELAVVKIEAHTNKVELHMLDECPVHGGM